MDPPRIKMQKLSWANLRVVFKKFSKTDIIHFAMANKWARDRIVSEMDLGYSAYGHLTVSVWNKDYQQAITPIVIPFESEEYAHINCRKEPLEKRDFEQTCLDSFRDRQFRHLSFNKMDAARIFFNDPFVPYTETTEYIIRSLEAANVTCVHLHWNLNSHYSEAVKVLKPKVVDCQDVDQLDRAMDEHFPIFRLHLINLPFYPELMKYEYLSQYSKDIAFDAFLNELNYVIKTFKTCGKPSELYVAWGDVSNFNKKVFIDHCEAQGQHFFKYQEGGEQNLLTLYWVLQASHPETKEFPVLASCLLYKQPHWPYHTCYLLNCRLVKHLNFVSFRLAGPRVSNVIFPWKVSYAYDPVPKEFVEFNRAVRELLS